MESWDFYLDKETIIFPHDVTTYAVDSSSLQRDWTPETLPEVVLRELAAIEESVPGMVNF